MGARRRRLAVASVLALVASVLIGGVALAARSMGLYEDLQQAQRALTDAGALAQRAGASITTGQAVQVGHRLAEADASLARAAAVLDGDLLLGGLKILPPVANQLDAASDLVRAARAVTRRSGAVLTVLDGYIAARDGRAGANRMAAFVKLAARLRPQTDDLSRAFDEADGIAGAVPAVGLVDPLERARTLLIHRLDQVRPVVAAAKTASSVLPSIMGVDGQRRYLVLALDNAEIRPIGGLIAAFATPTFENGSLRDMTFKDIQTIDRRDQKTYVKPPDPLADHLLGAFTWQVADAGWWPDFAESVKEVRRLYRIETRDDDLQGVIAFTPEFVDRLLEVVGPVTIASAGITVKPGDTYLVSLEQVEVLNRGEGRKAFLADLASQVLDRLFALPPGRYPEVLSALDEAGKRRQLQIQFDDPTAQTAVDAIGWPGAFTFPPTGDRLAIMEANVAPVSKLDVLLDLDHSLDVRLNPDGSATETLVTTYTNRYGPDLPPELERVRSTFLGGILGSYSRRYLVPAAEVTSVRSDDPTAPATDPDAEEAESGSLAVGNYQFVRPGTVHLTTEYIAPNVVEPAADGAALAGTYHLTYRKQAGRDRDNLIVRVTVPAGTKPTAWSAGGVPDGSTITFSATSEFDHTFEVAFGPA
jgi:hypothetical protein